MSAPVQSCEVTRDEWDAMMDCVERWKWKWKRHLHVDDDLDELVQSVRISAWEIAASLARRGKWVPGLMASVVYYAWRRGWDKYRRDHKRIGVYGLNRKSWASYVMGQEGESYAV